MVLKPMAISNSCRIRTPYAHIWGDAGNVSPFHAKPLRERSVPRLLSSILQIVGQARSSAARLSDEGIALLPVHCVHRARRSRQLQHRCVLAFAQPSEQHHLPVRELQRIVMDVRIANVDPPEPSHFLPECHIREKSKKALVLDFFSNATSVPGKRHTATFGSPIALNPRVMEFSNFVVINSSPTLAGRDATRCRL